MATHLIKFGVISYCNEEMTKDHNFTKRMRLVDCKKCIYAKVRGDSKPPAKEVIIHCHNKFKIPRNIDYMRFCKWSDEKAMAKLIRSYDLDVIYAKTIYDHSTL